MQIVKRHFLFYETTAVVQHSQVVINIHKKTVTHFLIVNVLHLYLGIFNDAFWFYSIFSFIVNNTADEKCGT